MHPLYLSIQGTCRSTRNSPTAIAFSAVDPLVIAGPRIGEHAIRRAVAYALYGGSGCGEQQLPDADSLRTRVTFVFWAHGHAWEVSRSGARRAGDAARDTACSLRRMGDADQTGSVLEGARQVNRRIAELLELDGQNPLPPRRRPATRCRSAEPAVGEGDARDDVSAPGEVERLRECMKTVRRETAALRRATAALHEATTDAAIAHARHRHARAALVEQTAVLREINARPAAAVERLQTLRARCDPNGVECVSTRSAS